MRFLSSGLLVLLVSISISVAGTNGKEDRKFDRLVEQCLELRWNLYPLEATFNGIHKYDDRIESFLIEEARKNLDRYGRFIGRIKQEINRSDLSGGNQIDYDLIFQDLDAREFALSRSRDLERDPGIYPNTVSQIGFVMFTREYAPFPERMANLEKRMVLMPRILEAAKKNLKNPPKLWTEIAIEATKGSIQLFQEMIEPSAARLPENDRKAFNNTTAQLVSSLQDYESYLEKELLPRSSGDFADGRENFEYRLKHFYLIDQLPEEILATAEKVLEQTKTEMDGLAKKIDANKTWWDIIREGKRKHFSADQVLPQYEKCAARARQWILDNKLVTIPEEKLDVIETPVFMRFIIPYAAYFSPAPFEKEQKGFYFVTPLDKSLSKEEQEGQLSELYVDMEDTTVHEAWPGHHLQFIHQNRLSGIRRMSDSSLMSEGWGLYCERLGEEFKFFSTPADSMEAYRWLMVRAIRVIVDIGIHTRGMSFKDAVNLMVETAHLEKASAEGEVRRYTQSPTQPLSYLMGMQMIYDLRAEYKKAKGDNFSLRDFHDELLSYGSIPMKTIRQSMIGK